MLVDLVIGINFIVATTALLIDYNDVVCRFHVSEQMQSALWNQFSFLRWFRTDFKHFPKHVDSVRPPFREIKCRWSIKWKYKSSKLVVSLNGIRSSMQPSKQSGELVTRRSCADEDEWSFGRLLLYSFIPIMIVLPCHCGGYSGMAITYRRLHTPRVAQSCQIYGWLMVAARSTGQEPSRNRFVFARFKEISLFWCLSKLEITIAQWNSDQ